MQLDKSQLDFIQAPSDQNIRLLAPAGCGKTLRLLHRCKFLAEHSATKQNFLVVTFTRAARDELRSRVNEDPGFADIRDLVEISTLNSWGYRQIKREAFSPKLITSRRDFHFTMRNQLQPVWRNHEQVRGAIQSSNRWKSANAPRNLMDMIDSLKTLGFDHKRQSSLEGFNHHWKELEGQGLGWRLQEQVDQLIKFDVLTESATSAKDFYCAFYQFWVEATARLIDEATFTLEDQKYFAYQHEQTNVDNRGFLSGAAALGHVFVDEFQDINPLDLALVRAMVKRRRATLTIAGDDDQAIFEWRGATPEYILEPDKFLRTRRRFVTHTLATNYRSPSNIVLRSQSLIKHNKRRVAKQISSNSLKNAQIDIKKLDTLRDSLNYVHKLLNSSISQGTSPSRLALISRKRSQIIPYQVFFASKDIPFCAAEDLQVFLSATFERLIRLLTVKEDADRRRSASNVLNDITFFCDYVKRYPLNKKTKLALKSHLLSSRPRTIRDGIDALADYHGELKGKNVDGETSLDMADAISQFIDAESVTDALLSLSTDFEGFQYDFGKSEEDIFFADPPFLYLAEYARQYEDDFASFVDDIEVAKDTLVYTPPFEDDVSDENLFKRPIHLMTALRAKGKEFDKVVLLDVQDQIWPNRNARTQQQLEAERRVFYVAFTRAREQVTMLLHKGAVPSPYIQELGL
ncbi:MAG: ATP-dependent helicase [Chloroflexi bacterium]|nr:ATP-dependent helicase [Chloroflexota bacterium]